MDRITYGKVGDDDYQNTEKLKGEAMRKITALLLTLAIMASISVPASAACQTPGCVKRAAQTAMDESGMDVCLVIKLDSGCNGKGTAYMMYRTGRKVKCDRSGSVIVGKNERIRKKYHYFAYRNRSYETRVTVWNEGGTRYRYRWGIIFECAEDADHNLDAHSYIEYKVPGNTWATCKGASRNVDGVAMCKEFAHYLRSMLDPDCPVIFL